MSRPSDMAAAALLASALVLTTASPAQTAPAAQAPAAQAPAAQAPAAPPPPAVADEYTGPPNRPMLAIGLLTLVMGYVPAAAVASSSNATDGFLLAPLAGPWIDLATRPGCGGPGTLSCRAETWDRTLLVADGVVQAWGLFATVLSLFQKETVYSRVQVAPAVGTGGYGVAAFGVF